jgi:hypothetical protein
MRAYRAFTATIGQSIKSLHWDALPGSCNRGARGSKSLRQIEFCAHVEHCARRVLSSGDHAIFTLHFAQGLREPEVCAKLHLKSHEYNYRREVIKATLGQAFSALRPFALFPIDFYLHGVTHQADVRPFPATEETRYTPIRPPMREPGPKLIKLPDPDADLIEHFLMTKALRTRPSYRYAIQKFRKFVLHKPLGEITSLDVRGFDAALASTLEDGSRKSYLVARL